MSIDTPQFVWPTGFACTIITENSVIPNSYSINISIIPLTDAQNIAIGFRKLRHFVENYLQNSIFVFKENKLIKPLENIDTNIVLFPTEPYDYFVGSVLYSKFLSISEKYFHIDLLSIDSAIGDNVQYSITDPEDCGLELSGDHWWNMDSTNTGLPRDSSWGDWDINDGPKFEPRIIKGGRSED
jgi:hypothetical protein